MRDDGYCSDDDPVFTRQRRRRRESCQSFTCISPWFIFSRLFSGNKPKGGSKIKVERKWEEEKIDENLNMKGRRNEGMKGYDASSSCSAPNDSVSAEIQKEASFNLLVGFGLIYLVAASRNELHKMAELHKKIELLLQNFPIELQIQEKKQPFLPSKSTTFVASSSNTHDQYEEEHDPGQYLSSHDVIKSPEIGLASNRYRREKSLKMDQLEAELAAEFDRLQLQIDTQQSLEVDVEDSAPEESQSTNFEEVISEVQPDESSNCEFYGVCPSELERRLHELLESRQHERIIELESALECTMQQLEEKENQLSWWKDTARLVSQHLPGLPSLFMRDVTQSSRRDETKILSLGFEKSFV